MKHILSYTRICSVATYLVALFIVFGTSACNKDKENGASHGDEMLNIQLMGTESDEGNNPLTKSGATVAPQTVVLPFGEGMRVTATLEEVSRGAGSELGQVKTKAGIVRNPLEKDVKYGLLVYDDQGALIAERSYIHKDAVTRPSGINNLVEGNTYTCIAYSINSKTDLPVINSKNSLAAVTTALTNKDLMIHKSEVTIANGMNTLQLVLKHKFTEIIPSIAIQTNITASNPVLWGGKITSIGTAVIKNTHQMGAVKLSDNVYSWSSGKIDNAVVFPSIPVGGVTSLVGQPILLMNPTTASGNFSISNMTINAVTDKLDLNALRIEPGKKYNLKLNFNSPCIEEVGAQAYWVPNHTTAQWSSWSNLPNADFGFMLDIHTLDNSVNMEVNGRSVVETKRTFQYRTRTTRTGTWGAWVTVTDNTASRHLTRTAGNEVSFPLHWDWMGDDLGFQQSAKKAEDFAVNNVEFADHDIYGGPSYNEGGTGNIQPLWNDTYWNGACCRQDQASPNGPIIKMQVIPNSFGTDVIRIYGKRTINGAYEPMQIIPTQTSMTKYYYNNSLTNMNNSNELNANDGNVGQHLREERVILETRINPNGIVWHSGGGSANTVRTSQRIVNRTLLYARGYGIRRVVCAP